MTDSTKKDDEELEFGEFTVVEFDVQTADKVEVFGLGPIYIPPTAGCP